MRVAHMQRGPPTQISPVRFRHKIPKGPIPMIQIVGAIAAGAATLGGAGLTAVGNALFDFALNPSSKRSIMARINSGEGSGLDVGAYAQDPFRQEARAWFLEARRDATVEAARGGGVLHGWRIWGPGVVPSDDGRRSPESPDTAHRYLILCHGYSGQPSDLAGEAMLAHRAGFSVILPAARGHERNRDRYVGMGWLDAFDLMRWIQMIVTFDPEAKIALYGVSMGAAEVMMASGLDLPPQVRCIVEDCGYTSVWDELAQQMGDLMHLPVHPLLDAADAVCRARAGYGFREASAIERLRRARVPMLFIHGTADTFVPYRMLDELYDACASEVKEKVSFEGAGHGASSQSDPGRYWDVVSGFLARHL